MLRYFGALRLAAMAATPPAKQRVVLMPLGGTFEGGTSGMGWAIEVRSRALGYSF